MAYYTHISVCFSADDSEIGRDIARKHIRNDEYHPEFDKMLEAFASGQGFFVGRKGALFNWGIVGNHTNPDEFAARMVPFLEELRHNTEETGLFWFDHVLVFYEGEGSESAQCFEIMPYEDNPDSPLSIRHHKDLPFAWMQM